MTAAERIPFADREKDYEDLRRAVRSQLAVELRALWRRFRENPSSGTEPLLGPLIVRTVRDAWFDHLRWKYPQRYALQSRLRYLFCTRQILGIWEDADGEFVCGLAAWNPAPAPAWSIPSLTEKLRAAAGSSGGSEPFAQAWRTAPAPLMQSVLESLGQPVRLDDLTQAFVALLGLVDSGGHFAGYTPGPVFPPPVRAPQSTPQRFLEQFWEATRPLPRLQKAVFLLGLRDAAGLNAIELLPLLGVASVREIAESLALPAAEFALLWNQLPLSDDDIATRLGLRKDQVPRLRRAARCAVLGALRLEAHREQEQAQWEQPADWN